MNFAEKIKADFEAITGLTLLYGSRDGINWAINHNALPAGFFTLIRSSNVNADGLSLRESAEVAVSVIRLSPAEEPGYETETVIEECRQQVFAYLTALKSSGLMRLLSVTRASRIFDEFDDIVCGFGVNILVEEIDGTRCIPWEGPTLNITENGDYETLRYGQVHVDVQGGAPAVIEQLDVIPDYDPHTFIPAEGVDGFNPVNVAACPIPQTETLHVTPTNAPQQFTPSAGNIGFNLVDVDAAPSPVLVACPVTPSTSVQHIVPPAGADGFSEVDVQAVDSSIDPDIQPINIRQGVDILGVVGTLQEITKTPLNITPSTSAQTYTAPTGQAYDPVQVDAVTASIDANIQAGNIKKDVSILGVVGTLVDYEAQYKAWNKAFFSAINVNQANSYIFPSDVTGEIEDIYGVANVGTGQFVFQGCAFEKITMSNVLTIRGRTFQGATALKEVVAPSCSTVTQLSFAGVTTLERLTFGTLVQFDSTFVNQNQTKLRSIVVGADTDINLGFGRWTATNVIAEGPSGEAELNYNIKTYLAAKVKDNSGGGPARTITFGTSLYNVLTADTLQAFSDRNWNVAYA